MFEKDPVMNQRGFNGMSLMGFVAVSQVIFNKILVLLIHGVQQNPASKNRPVQQKTDSTSIG